MNFLLGCLKLRCLFFNFFDILFLYKRHVIAKCGVKIVKERIIFDLFHLVNFLVVVVSVLTYDCLLFCLLCGIIRFLGLQLLVKNLNIICLHSLFIRCNFFVFAATSVLIDLF